MNVTKRGYKCQLWSSLVPHEHSFAKDSLFPDNSVTAAANYCRDPDNSGYAWCYTTNVARRWDECDESLCHRTAGNHHRSTTVYYYILIIYFATL